MVAHDVVGVLGPPAAPRPRTGIRAVCLDDRMGRVTTRVRRTRWDVGTGARVERPSEAVNAVAHEVRDNHIGGVGKLVESHVATSRRHG